MVNINIMNIVIAGVGYVGLVSGLGLAKLGHDIQFLDIDEEKINTLSRGESPFFEPELNLYINNKDFCERFNFTDKYEDIKWDDTEIFMICVQTPTSKTGEVDTSFLRGVFKASSVYLNDKTIICIKSTIHPLGIDKLLEEFNTLKDKIVFNPEFLREGRAFYDFFNPDRIVIGSNNEKNSKIVSSVYESINSEFVFTDPISSQLIKYLSNAYLPLRLSFVNEASQIIDTMGGNLKQVLEAIGLDSRIGSTYFRPSPGWGGSCFPKDVKEINNISDVYSLDLPLIDNIINSNNNHMSWFKDKILKIKNDNSLKNIIFIGAAFKEDTDDLRDSPTLKIYDLLKEELNDVYIYDNLVNLPDGYKKVQKFADSSVLIEMYPLDNETFNNHMLKINKLNEIFYFRFWEDSLNI